MNAKINNYYYLKYCIKRKSINQRLRDTGSEVMISKTRLVRILKGDNGLVDR